MTPRMEALEPRLLLSMGYSVPGDATFDCRVDLDDFVVVKRGIALAEAGWSDGDFTGDGVVSLEDFAVLKSHFGLDVLNLPVEDNPGTLKPDHVYTEVAGSLFVSAEADDAEQGYLADCYWVAAVAGVADRSPETIYQSIGEVGDGTFWVRTFDYDPKPDGNDYVERIIRIDGLLPTHDEEVIYAQPFSDGELWAPLMEKAWAITRYGVSLYAAVEGGWPDTVFSTITGKPSPSEWVFLLTPDQLTDAIGHALNTGSAVAMTSEDGYAPIVGWHVYTVIDAGDGWVDLYNPWGQRLTITSDVAVQAFILLSVSSVL